ncbi:unnamed protein product [Rotaria sp. Silwood1]|nr:unnamed protein product [Rotaria sp. Silwood1]
MSKTQVTLIELFSKNGVSVTDRGSSSVEPERGSSSSSLQTECGLSSSSVEPERGSSSSSLQTKCGSSSSSVEPEHGLSSSSLQTECGLSSVEPERGLSSSSLQTECGLSSSVEPERGLSSSSLETECGLSSSSVELERGLDSYQNNITVIQRTLLDDSECEIIGKGKNHKSINLLIDHNCISVIAEGTEKQRITSASSKHRTKYLSQWEKKVEAQFKTFIFDDFGGVQILPAQVSGISYRNSEAAMGFIQHISSYLHDELVEKIQSSPVVGWMLDETTSRTVEKSCIVFVRYIDNFEPKTAYYGLIDLEGDGTASNIVKSLSSLWQKDDIHVSKTCWLATDNASTFTGVHEGVVAKIRREFACDWLELNPCAAHTFSLVGSQSLLAYLQETTSDVILSAAERESAKNLLKSILNDEFLFNLHFHYDLHETVLAPLTKMMQNDKISYFSLMEMIKEKRKILENWTYYHSTSTLSPALSEYILLTTEALYGSFKINLGDRKKFLNDCLEHIHRLLRELDRRFTPSKVQESLSILFDPQYLLTNKKNIGCLNYGRAELDFLRQKYKKFPGFDSNIVRNEWESFKQSLSDFTTTNSDFLRQYNNILFLMNIYLISPTNSAECERGFSAINRIQATGRSRLKISTLDILMTVRMLLKDDLRSPRCQQVVNKAFESWNDNDYNRRYHQMQLLLDVPDDYTPVNPVRSVSKRSRDRLQSEFVNKKQKTKSKHIKCANGCKREVSETDPSQNEAIQCCHQNEQFRWIDSEENCSRWLCNYCRIKLGINIDSIWFCDDHVDMHHEEDEDQSFD